MHLHTVFSGDATTTVKALFDQAVNAKLSAIAITDHDTVDAIPHARLVAEKSGICLVPGVEASCTFAGRTVHLLVYSDQIDQSSFQDYLKTDLVQCLRSYAEPIVETLSTNGVPVSIEMYDRELQQSGPGGSPLLRVLQKKGVVRGPPDFRKRFASLIPTELIDRPWAPPLERVVTAAHDCGAVAILAHPMTRSPYGVSASEWEQVRGLGIDGLESYHPAHTEDQQATIHRYARRYGMLITGGSDYHGLEGRHLGQPGMQIPDRPLPAVIHLRELLRGAD